MRMSTKMIVGYILLIIIPFLTFAYFVYSQMNDKFIAKYQLANQQNIEQLAVNLDASLVKIESLYSIYQNNNALIEFLRGDYTNDRDLIYAYLKEIVPAISFSYLGDKLVRNLTIYPKYEERLLNVTGFKAYHELEDVIKTSDWKAMGPKKGIWTIDSIGEVPTLAYFHKIYNDSYSNDLGVLQITVQSIFFKEFLDQLRSLHPNNVILLVSQDGNIVYQKMDNSFPKNQLMEIKSSALANWSKTFMTDRNQMLVNSTDLSRLGLKIIEINQKDALFTLLRHKIWWITGGFALLALLTILYYVFVSSLTKRLILLSRHMRRVEADSLYHPYTGRVGIDEVGFLILNYNGMINRIDELVNRVQKVELLKKEAEFRMLQAQIQPHFLYNTLETMRMLARASGDSTVADMAYSLGDLLRYSLSKQDETTFQDELNNVKRYLSIHQIRMSDLYYEIVPEEGLMTLKCPRFILQPLVENSIIHGLSKRRGAKQIAIRFAKEQDYAIIEVSDNGSGISEDALTVLRQALAGEAVSGISETQGMGIGLTNVAERVKAYFGGQSGVMFSSLPGEGTVCSLRLYLKENGDAEVNDRRR
ncbi:two-component system sensor histidine kinase YesM [Paenibacillus sp. V4I7]|nr:two-component system sensor histidine kinase YesM [Paenibacillus sp. V4I7]